MCRYLRSQRGSALVISLLFMMILVVLSFSVNFMLMNEIRSERNFLSGLKAYYAAEAGAESALLEVSLHDAGTEIDPAESVLVEDVEDTSYTYTVVSREDSVPCSFEAQNDSGYAALGAGESVMVPLAQDEDFQVKYYVVNSAYPYDYTTSTMQNDVLRWKIIGNNESGNVAAISEYIPISSPNDNYANNPSEFGTNSLIGFTTGKFYDRIGDALTGADALYLDYSGFEDNSAQGAFQHIFHEDYPIATFLDNHTHNFLTLTNILNTIPPTQPELELPYNANDYVLYYKIDSNFEGVSGHVLHAMACTAVKVSADGFASNGRFKQSVDVVQPLRQGLPFTDFVWYQR